MFRDDYTLLLNYKWSFVCSGENCAIVILCLADFESYDLVTRQIPLIDAWNTISSYVSPNTPEMIIHFEQVKNEMILIKNGAGEIYRPAANMTEIICSEI